MKQENFTAEEWEAIPKKFDLFCKKVIANNARNQIRGYLRHSKQYKEVPLDELTGFFEGIYDEYLLEKTELRAGDESIFFESIQLAEAIRRLPERKQWVLLLAVALEYSIEEVAIKLNITKKMGSDDKYQALKTLRKEMEGDGEV